VPLERARAHVVIQKRARDYKRFFDIEAYLWDYEPMLASQHFQDSIDPPSSSPEIWMYSNRAHALMFLGRQDEARELYLKYRDEKNVQGGKSWITVTREDFQELRKAGLSSPLMSDIEQIFAAKAVPIQNLLRADCAPLPRGRSERNRPLSHQENSRHVSRLERYGSMSLQPLLQLPSWRESPRAPAEQKTR
jgi:hypothetical protein